MQAIQMLKCSSKRFVQFASCWSKRCSPRSQKTSESALLAFSDAFRCDSQNFALPAGRDGPSLRALLLLAARKSQAMLHVLICFISQHFRGAAAQRKLELRRSAFCARLLRRYSCSNILVAAHVKAGTTFCGNQSFTLCFCCLTTLAGSFHFIISRDTELATI